MNHKPYVGIWLDHREAILLWSDSNAEMEINQIKSAYQEEGDSSDGDGRSKSDSSMQDGSVQHDASENRRSEQLKAYYKKLCKAVRPANQIYLFGPGQAKKELSSLLHEDKSLRASILEVDGADKRMTRPQMAARVREKFGLPETDPTLR